MFLYLLYYTLIECCDVFGVFDLLPLYDPYDDPDIWESLD